MTDVNSSALFARLGGHAAVAAVVADLYDRILDDDHLASFFVGVSVESVMAHQRELVTTAVGGPSGYTGRSLREAHAGYEIGPHHLDRLRLHLAAALAASGVAPTDVVSVMNQVARLWHAQFWGSGNAE